MRVTKPSFKDTLLMFFMTEREEYTLYQQ